MSEHVTILRREDPTEVGDEADGDGSIGSVSSVGSIGSLFGVGSIGSIAAVGSIGSILSIGSIGSIASVGSIGSIGSVLSVGAHRGIGSFFGVELGEHLAARVARRLELRRLERG